MTRSSWKNMYVHFNTFVTTLNGSNDTTVLSKPQYVTKARNCTITETFIGKTYKIYNGKSYVSIEITPDMVGHKLGEFVKTKRRAIHH